MLEVPLVSVVTLTYNRFDDLNKTVNSVILQDYPNIEYIIYDDGSEAFPQDDISKLLSGSKLKNRVYRQNNNVGTVRNANAAYRVAEGEIIINLSCGDIFYDSNVITKIYNRINDTNCNVLITSRIMYDNDGPICYLPHLKERSIINKYNTQQKQYELFISGNHYDMASGSALAFRTSFIKQFGLFDESYMLWEDGPFLQKYLYEYTIQYAYDIVSMLYKNDGISHSKNQIMLDDIYRFNTVERLTHYNEMSFRVRRVLRYRKYQALYQNNIVFRLIQLAFIPEVIRNYIYTKRRKHYFDLDRDYLSRKMRNTLIADEE